MKTLQMAFDKAVTGIYKQARRSVNSHGDCMYRGINGSKCAIGFIIDDKFFCHDMEQNTISDDDTGLLLPAIKKSGYPTNEKAKAVYTSLQAVHDEMDENLHKTDFQKQWYLECKEIAEKFNLEIPRLVR